MRAVFQQLMTLQTSVWFKCVIDRSKALCKAIYYIPAAHQMHSGKLLIHLINDPFHAMTPNQYFTLFINIVPAFQPSHLLSRIALLQVRAANFGAFNISLYSARYCVLHFVLVIQGLFHVICSAKTSFSENYFQLFIFTGCTCQSRHLLEALLRGLLP